MACYKPTKKNKQLENKYEELGFIETEKSSLSVNYKLDNIKKFDLLVEVNYE